ncbi:alpha/beta fold hydrolase [Streptomyces rishiriensis]|uniref:Pimeloyl-ACP methyl ester carboxylesterase n=1 Tax=Streptomyces rishiriensis TaxID=68264 RepID=A0ABU0P2Z7_STRRH|nr:alpha/beta hydrolase [Streptomyces rishiriensis]MDQ0585770.1 pimeloyl-ACP methyl ester carboxylesterase [Streptomyces rishiriensis]
MNDQQAGRYDLVTSYRDAPTRTLTADGVTFAYRELGPRSGTPVVFLTHLAAVLDNWDPRVVDGIAAKRHVITFDNRGVGASSGSTPRTIQEMAKDAVTFIRALGLEHVDIHGFSMGGMIAQVIARTDPHLVRKMILSGTGSAGGEGIKNVTVLSHLDTLRALVTLQDPKQFLFFTRTATGRRAGKEFLARLKERTTDRDKAISPIAYNNQLKAIHRWGLERPHDLSVIHQPVLVANGDSDRMVPSKNSADLARRLPNAELVIYPDAGHGGIFQSMTGSWKPPTSSSTGRDRHNARRHQKTSSRSRHPGHRPPLTEDQQRIPATQAADTFRR